MDFVTDIRFKTIQEKITNAMTFVTRFLDNSFASFGGSILLGMSSIEAAKNATTYLSLIGTLFAAVTSLIILAYWVMKMSVYIKKFRKWLKDESIELE